MAQSKFMCSSAYGPFAPSPPGLLKVSLLSLLSCQLCPPSTLFLTSLHLRQPAIISPEALDWTGQFCCSYNWCTAAAETHIGRRSTLQHLGAGVPQDPSMPEADTSHSLVTNLEAVTL